MTSESDDSPGRKATDEERSPQFSGSECASSIGKLYLEMADSSKEGPKLPSITGAWQHISRPPRRHSSNATWCRRMAQADMQGLPQRGSTGPGDRFQLPGIANQLLLRTTFRAAAEDQDLGQAVGPPRWDSSSFTHSSAHCPSSNPSVTMSDVHAPPASLSSFRQQCTATNVQLLQHQRGRSLGGPRDWLGGR